MPVPISLLENIDILICERDENIFDSAFFSLGIAGYDDTRINRVRDGLETIEKINQMQSGDPKNPLVVILDPTEDSGDYATIIRNMDGLERTPLLVSCCATDIRLQPYSVNFSHSLTKPFTPTAALALVRTIEKGLRK
jgi:CheY-like chemotaxis protein